MARSRVPGADVRVAAAEAVPFDDDSFDVVVSQLVLNFMTDTPAGVAEMCRTARRTIASCVWDYAGEMEMLRVFWDAALEIDPDAPDEGRVMRWCSPAELEELWKRAGLREVEVGELVVRAEYDDFDDYWAPFRAGIAPSGAYCASVRAARQEALRQACYRLTCPTSWMIRSASCNVFSPSSRSGVKVARVAARMRNRSDAAQIACSASASERPPGTGSSATPGATVGSKPSRSTWR